MQNIAQESTAEAMASIIEINTDSLVSVLDIVPVHIRQIIMINSAEEETSFFIKLFFKM